MIAGVILFCAGVLAYFLLEGVKQGNANCVGCLVFWAVLALLFSGPVGWFILLVVIVGYNSNK